MTLTFAHNPARQIVSRSVPAAASFYAYSPGNGDTTYGVDGLNRLTTAGPASLGYDGRGNLTAVGSATYDYDKANRLVATGEGASLTYDPIDRLYRTAKSGFQTTKFLYDGPNLIAEYDDAGTAILRRYVHGPGVDEPLVWYEGPTVNDKRWHQADNQGSILAMSQGLGGTLGTYRYDAYGQLYVDPGQISRFQYTGQTAVPEVGLLNYKARMYSPSLGRFMQTDRVGYQAGLNLYAYVRDDPINNADPTGNVLECLSGGDGCNRIAEFFNTTSYSQYIFIEGKLQIDPKRTNSDGSKKYYNAIDKAIAAKVEIGVRIGSTLTETSRTRAGNEISAVWPVSAREGEGRTGTDGRQIVITGKSTVVSGMDGKSITARPEHILMHEFVEHAVPRAVEGHDRPGVSGENAIRRELRLPERSGTDHEGY